MSSYVLPFRDIDRTKLAVAGGKGANLGELCKIEGIQVPDGFCINVEAYRKITAKNKELDQLLKDLSHLKSDQREKISEIGARIRTAIENIVIADDLVNEIVSAVQHLGETNAFAVRSSATAEDLPTASFAGQQDTFLNIKGVSSIIHHIHKCWASLFTDRAITYRIQNGFDHRKVYLAVIVQIMIPAEASGVLFTADPISGNRKVSSIDAGSGLGDELVSGLINPDNYKVNNGSITDKQEQSGVLTDIQIFVLEKIGRTIEKHFGRPQDIEWCLANGSFHVVQSRPITTLYPIPQADDSEDRVYVSVGHQQMMTDAMKPLGLSFFLLTTRAPMRTAGGRLFVDITGMLAAPGGKDNVMNTLGKSDPLINDALLTIINRKGFVKTPPAVSDGPSVTPESKSSWTFNSPVENDPKIVDDLINKVQTSLQVLKKEIELRSGSELLDFIVEDLEGMKKSLFDSLTMSVIMCAVTAPAWLNEKIYEWLGDKNVADTIAQSVSNNITSEMGLALMDVADVIRPYPKMIEYLQQVKEDNFLEGLLSFEGGQNAKDAIGDFLVKYGMRCSGEIDISKSRWSEKPAALVPMILTNVRNFQPGAGTRRFSEGKREALNKELDVLNRLKDLPDGEEKVKETKRVIDLIRTFSGFREYPKYGIVSRYYIYKQALLKEAAHLLEENVIHDVHDIYYLTFQELKEVIQRRKADFDLIAKRKDEFKYFEKLAPPRLITSDGEIITGSYKRDDMPKNALVGLAVSSGTVEGRARIILNIEEADLEEGDILVTTFTDPSWTPLFVSIKGLVTEVGGIMTHGAVIAREYGLPAVVCVVNATRLIRDGQRIRVNGRDGYVEIL